MSQSELLFFLSTAVAIVLFGIVLPVWEALSSTSSSNLSNKKKKKPTCHKFNETDTYELEYSFDDDENDDIMEAPCQLKIYVPGTGVIFLTGENGGDATSTKSSLVSLSSRSSWSSSSSSSSNGSSTFRRCGSVGSSGSQSSCGSWCMETIEESEEEDIIDDDEGDHNSEESATRTRETTSFSGCPELDETTAKDYDDDED